MKKIFVAYDTKYGNTKIVAETILKGIEKVARNETGIGYVKEIDIGTLANFDLIILGAPNHMGRPSWTMKKFVNKLAKLDLKSKNVAVFGTYSGKIRTVDRAVKKLVKMVQEKLPNQNLALPGLSIRVKGIRGPIRQGELPKCVDFGNKLATQLE